MCQINDIFDQEYSPTRITNLLKARQGHVDFNFKAENLGIATGVPTRIIQELDNFISKQMHNTSSSPLKL